MYSCAFTSYKLVTQAFTDVIMLLKTNLSQRVWVFCVATYHTMVFNI